MEHRKGASRADEILKLIDDCLMDQSTDSGSLPATMTETTQPVDPVPLSISPSALWRPVVK